MSQVLPLWPPECKQQTLWVFKSVFCLCYIVFQGLRMYSSTPAGLIYILPPPVSCSLVLHWCCSPGGSDASVETVSCKAKPPWCHFLPHRWCSSCLNPPAANSCSLSACQPAAWPRGHPSYFRLGWSESVSCFLLSCQKVPSKLPDRHRWSVLALNTEDRNGISYMMLTLSPHHCSNHFLQYLALKV